ncbi:MAG: DUF4870 domain-containing protein [Actinomycetota bacterium]
MENGGTEQQIPAPQPPGGEQRTWAVTAHLLAVPGNALGLGWIGPLVIWVKCRRMGSFVAFHALQTMFFQLGWTALMYGLVRIDFLLGHVLFYPMVMAGLIPVAWNVIAAVKAKQGEWYQYPCAGRWAQELIDEPV